MQLVNSRNFLHLRTYNRDNNFILFKNILGRSITSRLLTTPITKNDNDLNDLPDNQDEEEILKTHQIPGRYLHYFKKNRRQLKKEARQESQFGDNVCILFNS